MISCLNPRNTPIFKTNFLIVFLKGVLNFYFSKTSVGITFTFTLREMTIFSARTYTVYHFPILWMKPSTV